MWWCDEGASREPAVDASGKANTTPNGVQHDLSSSVQEEVGLSRSGPAPNPSASIVRWKQKTATSSQVPAVAATGNDETMEQEGLESKRDSGPWLVSLCVLSNLTLKRFLWETLARMRSTRDLSVITRRERLAPYLVKIADD